jgi:Zn-dependent protease
MDILLFLPVLLISVVVHEVAHAQVARLEGDDTAYRMGRITLNPIPHLDLMGSIVVPLVLYFLPGSFLFG